MSSNLHIHKKICPYFVYRFYKFSLLFFWTLSLEFDTKGWSKIVQIIRIHF